MMMMMMMMMHPRDSHSAKILYFRESCWKTRKEIWPQGKSQTEAEGELQHRCLWAPRSPASSSSSPCLLPSASPSPSSSSRVPQLPSPRRYPSVIAGHTQFQPPQVLLLSRTWRTPWSCRSSAPPTSWFPIWVLALETREEEEKRTTLRCSIRTSFIPIFQHPTKAYSSSSSRLLQNPGALTHGWCLESSLQHSALLFLLLRYCSASSCSCFRNTGESQQTSS